MTSPTAVRRRDLWRVAWGTLFLQGAFNTECRQGIGVAAALVPVARLFPPDRRREFLTREIDTFNTNPAMAGPILGGVVRCEEQAAGGDESAARRVVSLKRALQGPLAAAGDSFFWLGLRPAAAFMGSALALFAGSWGPVVFLVIYNTVHLGLRMGGVFWGYANADSLPGLLHSRWLRQGINRAPTLAWMSALLLAATVGARAASPGEGAALAGGLLLGAFWGRSGPRRGGILLVGGIILGLVLTFLLSGGNP